MKTLTETQALQDLRKIKKDFQNRIGENYEANAQSCATCPTQGACCLDAHFVNVRLTRLEAVAVRRVLSGFNLEKRREIDVRISRTIEEYDLKADADADSQTFACPLFEKNVGCLVHETGKPAPCIAHACYENQADLPPENLLDEVEMKIARLNKRTYGKNWNYLPLPVWLNLLKPDF